MTQNTIRSSLIITRATRSMKLSEEDTPGDFETPWWIITAQDREATSATEKKAHEWISSDDESDELEEDKELKLF